MGQAPGTWEECVGKDSKAGKDTESVLGPPGKKNYFFLRWNQEGLVEEMAQGSGNDAWIEWVSPRQREEMGNKLQREAKSKFWSTLNAK